VFKGKNDYRGKMSYTNTYADSTSPMSLAIKSLQPLSWTFATTQRKCDNTQNITYPSIKTKLPIWQESRCTPGKEAEKHTLSVTSYEEDIFMHKGISILTCGLNIKVNMQSFEKKIMLGFKLSESCWFAHIFI